jgi:phosphoesterase RecJ-like protein
MNARNDIPRVSRADAFALLASGSHIVVTSHVHPDGDAVGSAVALALHLRRDGKEVRVVLPSPVPENLAFLAAEFPVERYDPAAHDAAVAAADLIVALDLNDARRLRALESAVLASVARKLVIDHHLDPAPFADAYLLDTDACATAAILAAIFASGPDAALTRPIAEALYVGIMTDTGSFRFDRTTAEVHRLAGRLLDAGVDPSAVYRKIYDDYPVRRTRLLGRALSTVAVMCGGRASVIAVTPELLADTGAVPEDVENVVNFGLAIRGVEVAALLSAQEGGVKISFRSRGAVRVDRLAAAMGGGGHAFASGAFVDGAVVEEVYDDVARRLCGLFDAETAGA